MSVLVCSACGSPACWDGEFMCEDSMRAGTAKCPCDWGDDGRGWQPVAIDAECPAHGDDAHEVDGL